GPIARLNRFARIVKPDEASAVRRETKSESSPLPSTSGIRSEPFTSRSDENSSLRETDIGPLQREMFTASASGLDGRDDQPLKRQCGAVLHAAGRGEELLLLVGQHTPATLGDLRPFQRRVSRNRRPGNVALLGGPVE